MTDRGTPTPIDAIGLTELLVRQDELSRGIETLLVELISYNLSPTDRAAFDKGRPIEVVSGQPKISGNTDLDKPIITRIRQESYEDPNNPGSFVQVRRFFNRRQNGIEVSIFADYGDTTPRGTLTRAGFMGVNTINDLVDARVGLANKGLLPPAAHQTPQL